MFPYRETDKYYHYHYLVWTSVPLTPVLPDDISFRFLLLCLNKREISVIVLNHITQSHSYYYRLTPFILLLDRMALYTLNEIIVSLFIHFVSSSSRIQRDEHTNEVFVTHQTYIFLPAVSPNPITFTIIFTKLDRNTSRDRALEWRGCFLWLNLTPRTLSCPNYRLFLIISVIINSTDIARLIHRKNSRKTCQLLWSFLYAMFFSWSVGVSLSFFIYQ